MINNTLQKLGLEQKMPANRRKYIGYATLIAIVVALLSWWYWPGKTNSPLQYMTAAVQQNDLTVTVTATGILQPLNQVDVGTEISGTVEKIYVDFNDHVKAGQLLAKLDTKQLSAKLRQSQAALALARAQVKESNATVLETKSKLGRNKDLINKKLISQAELETSEATYRRAIAALDRAKAQVTQAQAQLDADKTTLSKTEIRSPINGIVLKRQIEPGQTVAASLQTPVLFTLAENLAQMELHVSVDEADVGMVKEGQKAIFKVDAFQQRSFPAIISQVRYAPQTVEGVVTYETILSVNNEDLALRPGMTATAEIIVSQLKNVLLVPNTALRFTPPEQKAQKKTSLINQLFRRHPPESTKKPGQENSINEEQHQVWILRDNIPVPINVEIGATDGQVTEITNDELKPGMQVITDTISTARR